MPSPSVILARLSAVTWKYVGCAQSVGEDTALMMSTSVSGAHTVKVTQTVDSRESLTPDVTACQVNVMLLHVCKQSSVTTTLIQSTKNK